MGMYYKRVEVKNKVVVEVEYNDKELGGDKEKYEAYAWSGLCTTTSSR